MDARLKVALGALGAAVLLGALADGLLRVFPWGLNLFIWVAALVCSGFFLAGRPGGLATPGARGWLLLAAGIAVGPIWRDSAALRGLSLLAILLALTLATFRSARVRLAVAGIADLAVAAVSAAFHAALGFAILLLGDIRWESVPREGAARKVLAIGRGIAIALPVLLLFTGLFMAADAVFEGFVTELLNIDFEHLFTHFVLICIWTWIAGGFLRALLLAEPLSVPPGSRPLSLGIVELGTLLGLLNALFLGFVLVQIRYLFGGADLVLVSPGLTYAEYARRGFFELVTAAALVLPLLLAADWLLRRDSPYAERLFRGLAGLLLVLLLIVMASALQRMRLYQREYGLTELRLYTTAFMGWLVLAFGWFAATVLRGRRCRFAVGALATGLLALIVLEVLDPDAWIVRANVARLASGRPFDAAYAACLSADGVPELIRALPSVDLPDRGRVARSLLRRWSPPADPDWRTWSVGRARAWRAVATSEGRLWAEAGSDGPWSEAYACGAFADD